MSNRVQELEMERGWAFNSAPPAKFNKHLSVCSIHLTTVICVSMEGTVSQTMQKQIGHGAFSHIVCNRAGVTAYSSTLRHYTSGTKVAGPHSFLNGGSDSP